MNPRRWLRAPFDAVDALCARIFPPEWNPMAQLGALGWFFFWIVTVSGVYLYIFFDTGITATYQSIESITHAQWWAGGVMRSLHRYASDALVVMAFVHLLREFAHDRLRGNHWFAWITGMPLLLFIYACGITGYWLVWDTLAQYVAISTTHLLDALPIFGEPIARNFLNEASLSNRFFTLMVFIHIAVPLLMLLFMWVHISRHANARVNPARGLGVVVLGVLVLLALVHPALSQLPANLDRVPATINLDWFYLPAYPLIARWGGAAVWLAIAGFGLLLGVLPWLPPYRKPLPATVSLPNCNGCGRCFADCPFGAINLVARTDGLPYEQQASVNPSQCVSCGLCVGSCPTATPARSAGDYVAGIELPGLPLVQLREQVRRAAAGLKGEARVIVFGCDHGAACDALAGEDVAVLRLPCVGMLPPPFIDFILTGKLADGVMLAGCAPGDCYHRLGDSWVEQRIAGKRDPWLRGRVPRPRVAVSWIARGEPAARAAELASFRASLRGLPPMVRGAKAEPAPATRAAPRTWPRPVQWVGQALLLGALAALVGVYSTQPALHQLAPGEAVIQLAFNYAAKPKIACRPLTPEQMMALKPNMRRPVDCPRERWPVYVELERNGSIVYRGMHAPTGLWNDGPSSALERFVVPQGRQVLVVRLRDSGRQQGFDYERSISVDLSPQQNFVIEFRGGQGFVFQGAGP
jgi:ferredoxin/coenzyme F420-reducing hydrogenase delta subunit